MCNCKECKEVKEAAEGRTEQDNLKRVLEELIKKLNPILIIPVTENIDKNEIKTKVKIEIKGIELDIVPRLNIVPIPTIKIEYIKEENLQKEFIETCHSEKECGLKEEK